MTRFAPMSREIPVITPVSLAEVVQILGELPAGVIAGGTDLMVQMSSGQRPHREILVNILGLDELRYLRELPGEVRIGALTTYTELTESALVRRTAPVLADAAESVGSVQIRNRGTIGGNVMNASPAGDLLPPLLVLGASVTLASTDGMRSVPLYSFFQGRRKTAGKASELLIEASYPLANGPAVDYFRKVGARRAQAIAKASLAARATDVQRTPAGVVMGEVRLAVGSVAPFPLRLLETEHVLRAKPIDRDLIARARRQLDSEITPIDDMRSTAAYRRFVAGNMLEEFLMKVESAADSPEGTNP